MVSEVAKIVRKESKKDCIGCLKMLMVAHKMVCEGMKTDLVEEILDET